MKKRLLAALLAAAMTVALAGCGGSTDEPVTIEPDRAAVEKPSPDANDELAHKLQVGATFEPDPVNGLRTKYTIKIRNMTNDRLISAGVYLAIETEYGTFYEEFVTIEDLDGKETAVITGGIEQTDKTELVFLWAADYEFEEPAPAPEPKPDLTITGDDMLLLDQFGTEYVRLMAPREDVEAFLGAPEATEGDAALYLGGSLVIQYTDGLATTITTNRAGLQTPRGIHPGSTLLEIATEYGGDFETDGVGGMMLYTGTNEMYAMALEIEGGICQTITMTIS